MANESGVRLGKLQISNPAPASLTDGDSIMTTPEVTPERPRFRKHSHDSGLYDEEFNPPRTDSTENVELDRGDCCDANKQKSAVDGYAHSDRTESVESEDTVISKCDSEEQDGASECCEGRKTECGVQRNESVESESYADTEVKCKHVDSVKDRNQVELENTKQSENVSVSASVNAETDSSDIPTENVFEEEKTDKCIESVEENMKEKASSENTSNEEKVQVTVQGEAEEETIQSEAKVSSDTES